MGGHPYGCPHGHGGSSRVHARVGAPRHQAAHHHDGAAPNSTTQSAVLQLRCVCRASAERAGPVQTTAGTGADWPVATERRHVRGANGMVIVGNPVPPDEAQTAQDKPERHEVDRILFECSSGERTPDVPRFSSDRVTIRPQRPVREVLVQASVRGIHTASRARSRFP